jgi:O-antigen/teichoic acid export membrane protein
MNWRRSGKETRAYARSAAGLTVVLGLTGALTYVFFALAARALDKDAYGEIVVLWSIVFLLSATLFRPVEQLLARTLAEREQQRLPAGDALRTSAAIQTGVCVAILVALLAARELITDDLFTEDESLYWAMLVALAGYALAFYGRGFLAGRGQFRLYAALLFIEVSLRVAFAIIAVAGFGNAISLIAIGIATSPVAALVVLPLARRRRSADEREPAGPQEQMKLSLGTGGAFTGAVLLIMLSEQVLIGSGVLFVRAAEGAAAAGYIFNVLMVARAPLVLFQAIAASLLPHLTRMRARGDASSENAFKTSLDATMLLVAGFAVLTTIGVATIGPTVMQLAFGDKFEYDRLGLVIVAVGMGFYLVAASLNQATLAQGQAHRAARRWVACALVFISINLIAPFGAERSVEIGFATCAVLLAILLQLVYARPQPELGNSLPPGSPREVQARLEALDEIG